MSRGPERMPATGEDFSSDVRSKLDTPLRRSDLFRGAGKLGLGALTAGGLGSLLAACGSANGGGSTAAGATTGAASAALSNGRDKKIAVIEQTFSPFFTENFQKPLGKYLAATGSGGDAATTTSSLPGWSSTFGDEKGTVPTGIQLLNQYVAANYAVTILSTGDEMSAWEHAVKQATDAGAIFINHSTQAVAGATQNTLFSHKQAGVGVGKAAVAWAHKNGVSSPVVGLIGNLKDAQGNKRTAAAWDTIKAAFPSATLAGQVQGIDTPTGRSGAGNLLSAHPDINVLVCFNTLAGVGALSAAQHAGKSDRNAFFLGCADFEDATLKQIATGNSLMQANWATFFPASMILMARDAINQAVNGEKMKPTRLLLGELITTPKQARDVGKVIFDPLNPKYGYVYTKFFKYLNTPVGTGEVPPGQ